jgi:hypothetical protein
MPAITASVYNQFSTGKPGVSGRNGAARFALKDALLQAM